MIFLKALRNDLGFSFVVSRRSGDLWVKGCIVGCDAL